MRAPTADLFDDDTRAEPRVEPLAPGAVLLRGFARPAAEALLGELPGLLTASPWRHLETPGGRRMSVAMSNCGPLGWISDRRGYRYGAVDPLHGRPWPALPGSFVQLAQSAADAAGFARFTPDACLINRYAPGTRLALHQDRDEHDSAHPIVSVSLGLPATFLLGGLERTHQAQRIQLRHGDVVVWGRASRLRFHGVLPLAEGVHALLGAKRINLTFRRAG